MGTRLGSRLMFCLVAIWSRTQPISVREKWSGAPSSTTWARRKRACRMTHHVNPIKRYFQLLDSHSDGQPCTFSTHHTIDSRARYVIILFQCDDVIILQFDWTFLVLGHRAKYLKLVHQTVFHVRIWAGYETSTYTIPSASSS